VKNTVVAGIILLFLLTACDDPDDPINPDPKSSSPKSPAEIITYIDYSAVGHDVSEFIGRKWAKEGSDFTWIFKNDGTVTVIHCCGEVYNRQFSYLFNGNILITYGSEEFSDEIEATAITITEANSIVSLIRDNGISFTQGDWDTGFPSNSSLALSNDMLGTWRMGDGTEYEFNSDAGLTITTPSGDTEQYGYLVRYKALLILGPLIDGEKAALRQYRFNRDGNKLYLRRSDGLKLTLTS